jgi:hypothetical protein
MSRLSNMLAEMGLMGMRIDLACGHTRVITRGFPIKRKYVCPTCKIQQIVVGVDKK